VRRLFGAYRGPGRPVKHNPIDWLVDDWPERVSVSERAADVFEAGFGDILDELFGSPRAGTDSCIGSP
jgi:hypothetical protein